MNKSLGKDVTRILVKINTNKINGDPLYEYYGKYLIKMFQSNNKNWKFNDVFLNS